MDPQPHTPASNNKRILVIDDNRSIHADFRKILCPDTSARTSTDLDHAEAALFGEAGSPPPAAPACFEIDSAYQGEEGVALALAAEQTGRPYAMAFVDMRMPPGWDGLRTTQELWKACPSIQVVICTAHSDYSWDELLQNLGDSDRMVILKKPFDTIEVFQLAKALTAKWRLLLESRLRMADLEHAVQARTSQLETTNERLRTEILERRQTNSTSKKPATSPSRPTSPKAPSWPT
ncbi:MAG: response regulator [Opitutaceae bacterium]|nr:response regulator [Opitutaceae bacterium]